MSSDTNIKVVVRCRPLNSRELARGAKELIRMTGNQTFLDPPDQPVGGGKAIEKKTHAFSFDKSYWSAGPRDAPEYCSQETLYDDLGRELLDHGFEGFNACIVAYGQTGSGKSYSMMGYGEDKGIIPLTCMELFRRVEEKTARNPNLSFTVEVSYIEIYNEKVRDLLNPRNTGNLKVREHPILGPYVEDLSKLVVGSYDEMMTLMDEGNKARTVAATNMNETSSRSHAVFTLILTQKNHDEALNLDTEKASRISLVDLAGSERANSTGATGQRLKEGANINKSLTTLGKVIAALAAASEAPVKGKKKKADDFVPYRDSVLTWLLKDSLGGNSKTAMIAAISPADYEETLSTLRYADQAKKIKNKAVVNEDPNAKLVRELKEELDMLRARFASSSAEAMFDPSIPAAKQMVTYQTTTGEVRTISKAELQEQLETSEKLMKGLNETWEEKLEKTKAIQREREQALEELGITVERDMVGVHTPKRMPHLVNLNEDPLMSECLIYQLKPGKTIVGRLDGDKPAAIRLTGGGIIDDHCMFENIDGKVTLLATPGSMTMLNGNRINSDKPYRLRSGYRIILGDNHFFRFNNPEEVRKQRDRTKMSMSISASDLLEGDEGAASVTRPDTPDSDAAGDAVEVDWTYAKREAAMAHLNGHGDGFANLPDDDLNKLYHEISKVKNFRDHYAKSRPESSLSHVEEIWSDGRPPPSEITDDTSLEPNGGVSHGSPDLDSEPKDVQLQLESHRADFENKLNSMTETSESEDIKLEREHMQVQLKLVQNQMKRLMELRASGANVADFQPIEPVLYSARELRLIRKALEKWRAHKSFSMAETVLANAVVVKEANVLSKELDKNVTYNFTVLSGGSLSAPTSSLDDIGALGEFGDVADPVLLSLKEPTVGVKVLDKHNNAVYVWSLDRLQQQLQRIRNLTTFIDRPSYARHFSSEEPFYDACPPRFSFIGNALISLVPLARRLSSSATVPIFCRYTAEAIGSCRVDIRVLTVNTPAARTPINGSTFTSRSSSPLPGALPQGTKLTFTLTIDSVKGLSSLDFAAIHLQVRLSSFMGPTVAAEDVYPSPVIDVENSPLSDLKLRRTFSLALNAKVAAYLRQGYAPIEFFAEVKPGYLERLERWDEMREQHSRKDEAPARPSAMRRAETDFVIEERHDVIAWLQVCELTANGDYQGVPVLSQGQLDSGVFLLRQGLQRRLFLTLNSNSGKQLSWKQVTQMRVGRVRLLDAKGHLQDPGADDRADLKLLKPQSLDFRVDGTTSLTVEASWDSSVHDSILLNRVTGTRQRVLLQLDWGVEIDSCAEPANFSMDMAVAIQDRDARPPSLLTGIFSSTKVLTKTSAVFSLRLTPQLTRSAKDLWRLDTAEKYVRGEEVLGGWRPRGVSVVEDYGRLETMERRSADVQAIKILLGAAHSPAGTPEVPEGDEAVALMKKVLALWQKQTAFRNELELNVDPEPPTPTNADMIVDEVEPTHKLVPHTKLVPRSDTATKKGHLMMLVDATNNTWKRQWFVLRRPYLYVYAHSNELEEMSVIALNGVKIEHSQDMVSLFDKPFTFTLFTSSNSHALAAPNAKELQSWMTKLDPTRLPS